MPLFVNSNQNWFSGLPIPSELHTWPKPSSQKVAQLAAQTLLIFFVLVGPNVYSNRWVGWGAVLLPIALFLSFERMRMQGRDLKFCHLDCQNKYGGIFVVHDDVPQTASIAVYQNGTCDNWFQARHSLSPGPAEQQDDFMSKDLLDMLLVGQWKANEGKFSGQPYSGCFTWRTRIEVETKNIRVLDYAHLAATAGTFRRHFFSFSFSFSLSSFFVLIHFFFPFLLLLQNTHC
jgi:hypothetical protein